MFFVDDLVMSPFKGFLFIAREVAKAVEQEKEQERAEVMSQLALLHSKVEKGEITDDEFDELETKLLDRLEQLGR
jgi:uncharacterized membrane protein